MLGAALQHEALHVPRLDACTLVCDLDLRCMLFASLNSHTVLPANRHFLIDKLEFKKVRDTVAIHVPCSSKKMGIEESFAKLAGLCANEVVPSGIPCCGMAGDRGMRFPELTAASLQVCLGAGGCTGRQLFAEQGTTQAQRIGEGRATEQAPHSSRISQLHPTPHPTPPLCST